MAAPTQYGTFPGYPSLITAESQAAPDVGLDFNYLRSAAAPFPSAPPEYSREYASIQIDRNTLSGLINKCYAEKGAKLSALKDRANAQIELASLKLSENDRNKQIIKANYSPTNNFLTACAVFVLGVITLRARLPLIFTTCFGISLIQLLTGLKTLETAQMQLDSLNKKSSESETMISLLRTSLQSYEAELSSLELEKHQMLSSYGLLAVV